MTLYYSVSQVSKSGTKKSHMKTWLSICSLILSQATDNREDFFVLRHVFSILNRFSPPPRLEELFSWVAQSPLCPHEERWSVPSYSIAFPKLCSILLTTVFLQPVLPRGISPGARCLQKWACRSDFSRGRRQLGRSGTRLARRCTPRSPPQSQCRYSLFILSIHPKWRIITRA